jgi:mannosyl-oligosaccharide alpha-1,2-mannosidase
MRRESRAGHRGRPRAWCIWLLCALATLWYVWQVHHYLLGHHPAAGAPAGLGMRRASRDAARAKKPRARDVEATLPDAVELAAFLAAPPASVSTADRQRCVAAMTAHSWDGYMKHAAWADELQPLTRTPRAWLHLGLTAVDSLDTLWLAGLRSRFGVARDWAAHNLSVTPDVHVNLFETTIRVLGGLLSAHHLQGGDPELLAQAGKLADSLVAAFATPTGLPLSDVNLLLRSAKGPDWGPDSSVSETTTLRLEFKALAAAGGPAAGARAAVEAQRRVMTLARQSSGLATARFINPNSGAWAGGQLTSLGSRVDSYYEYTLKCWLHEGRRDAELLRAYQDAVHGVTTKLLGRSRVEQLLFVGELEANNRLTGKMDHLVCFYPGLLALGHMSGVRPRDEQMEEQAAALKRLGFADGATQLDVAAELTAGCRELYARNPLGMGPEIGHFNVDDEHATDDMIIKPADAHSLLRPEYVESLYVLWRVTGEQRYRDWGWDVWRGIERYARVDTGGYASLDSVLEDPPRQRDHMESFFVAETLKYLHLLFEDDAAVLPLDAWVLNTEAHPLPVLRGGG